MSKKYIIFVFWKIKKLPEMAAIGAGRCFFLIRTLPTFWATWIITFEHLYFLICWKPLTCGYVAASAFPFFFYKKTPPYCWKPQLRKQYLWVRYRRHFFPRKRAPIFLGAPNLWVRCRRLFFRKKGPKLLEAPNSWVRCRRRFF